MDVIAAPKVAAVMAILRLLTINIPSEKNDNPNCYEQLKKLSAKMLVPFHWTRRTSLIINQKNSIATVGRK